MTTKIRSAVVLSDLAAQLVLIVVGVLVIVAQDDLTIVGLLALWSLIATVYSAGAIGLIALSLRRPAGTGPSAIEHSAPARVVATAATLVSSVVGIGAAIQVVVTGQDPQLGGLIKATGVWAMLASWALLHWGFARIYAARYRLAAVKPLDFPGTDVPRLADFVYFAFTTGTSMASSDVAVTTSRMRWTVLWHSTLAYVFNAVIIVFAVNTIIG